MLDREVRAGQPVEVRADAAGVKVEGYAAVFGQAAMIGDMFAEIVEPGAFNATLARGADVTFLINHSGLPLARTSSRTLSLSVDSHGLKIASDLDPADPDVMRIVPKMKRGDLSKMSFAFRATRQEWDETGDIPVRHILEAELYDVSIVTDPAYLGTEIALRSLPTRILRPAALVARAERDLALRSRLLRA